MQTKIYFLLFFLFLFWTYCLYWPLKKQKKIDTPVEFFIYGRQMPSWIFVLITTGTLFAGWFFILHPSLILVNGLPFTMTSLSVIIIPLIGTIVMKRQWMLSKRFGFITPSEMIATYYVFLMFDAAKNSPLASWSLIQMDFIALSRISYGFVCDT